MHQAQAPGPSKARHLSPIIAGLVVLAIAVWIMMNSSSSDNETAGTSIVVIETLEKTQGDLLAVGVLEQKINQTQLVPGWRMMESYVIKNLEMNSQENAEKGNYAEMLALLTEFVEKTQLINSDLQALPADSVSPEFAVGIVQFGSHSKNLGDRLAALDHSIATGTPLPPEVYIPANFADKLKAEIHRLSAQ